MIEGIYKCRMTVDCSKERKKQQQQHLTTASLSPSVGIAIKLQVYTMHVVSEQRFIWCD